MYQTEINWNLGILAEYIGVLENFINVFIELFILMLIIGIIFINDLYVGIFVTLFSIVFIIMISRLLVAEWEDTVSCLISIKTTC